MKIGINFQLTDATPHPTELARKSEALGFESMFVNEHVIFPVNPNTPYVANPGQPIPEYYAHFADPFVALAMAAAVTTTIKLGTAVSLVTEHEPIALARTGDPRSLVQWPNHLWRGRRMAARGSRGDGRELPPPVGDRSRSTPRDERAVDQAGSEP